MTPYNGPFDDHYLQIFKYRSFLHVETISISTVLILKLIKTEQ